MALNELGDGFERELVELGQGFEEGVGIRAPGKDWRGLGRWAEPLEEPSKS